MVTDLDKIVKHYLKGWFLIDLIAIFPFNMIVGGGESLKLVRIFRLPKFLRFLEMSKMDELLDSALERFS